MSLCVGFWFMLSSAFMYLLISLFNLFNYIYLCILLLLFILFLFDYKRYFVKTPMKGKKQTYEANMQTKNNETNSNDNDNDNLSDSNIVVKANNDM